MGNYGVFLTMSHAGFLSSTVVQLLAPKTAGCLDVLRRCLGGGLLLALRAFRS